MHKVEPGTCLTCNQPMRRTNEPPDGRAIKRLPGLCLRCWRGAGKDPTHPNALTVVVDDTTLKARVHDLQDWMNSYVADRHRRGIPAEGIAMAGECGKAMAVAWVPPVDGEVEL